MKKRILALLVCIALLVSVVPLSVGAETVPSKEEQIMKQIRRTYNKTLASSGKESLRGYCGLMTGLQLYFLGITTGAESYNGKDQYDAYVNKTETSGGYGVKLYPGSQYSLEEALNQATKGGSVDVHNILVGFHRTNTEAGSLYGHAVVIHAILDGMVYFVEGFYTSIGGFEGTPIKCSIETFARFYDDWTTFEGLVVFGSKNYTEQCESYSSNLYARCEEPAQMMSMPGGPDCQTVRTAAAGERLWVTCLYENPEGELYYRVSDSGRDVYVKAEQVKPVWFSYEDVTLNDGATPQTLALGQHMKLTGMVRSDRVEIDSTFISITDSEDNLCQVASVENHGWTHDIGTKAMDQALSTELLDEGVYHYTVATYTFNHYVEDGQIRVHSDEVILSSCDFAVGEAELPQTARGAGEGTAREGWVRENGSWYYYQNGTPRTGWMCDAGISYYLDETGAAVTGWAQINGQPRFFSSTGAMRTGWLETEQGRMYMMRNGAAAKGLYTIDGSQYFFDEAGIVSAQPEITVKDQPLYLQTDGSYASQPAQN